MANISISDAVLDSSETVFNKKTKTGYNRLYFNSGFTKTLAKQLGCEKTYEAAIIGSESNSTGLREELRLTSIKILPKNGLEKYELSFSAEQATAFRLTTREEKPAKLRFTVVTSERIAAQIEDYLSTVGGAEAFLTLTTAKKQKGDDPEGRQQDLPLEEAPAAKAKTKKRARKSTAPEADDAPETWNEEEEPGE